MSGVLKPGQRFAGRYVVDGLIAEGGMASIYLAADEQLRRRVAVKVLYPYYADNEVIRARFAEEGRIQQMLVHPNVVEVYDVLERPLAIVMEHVDGPTLDDYLAEQGQLEESDTLDIAVAVMSALGLAHSQGIIHRDLKPSNILLRRGTHAFEPKVMDFGVAKVKDAKHNLTATGTTVGTLHYMSPEQIVGSKNIDGRADIYSLGVTLYKLVTGEVPFNAPTEFALMMAQVEAPPLPPSQLRPGLSPDLEAIILKAMAKKPIDRFQTIREFATALLQIRRGSGERTVRDTITQTVSQEIIDMAMAADEVAKDRTGEISLELIRAFEDDPTGAEPTVEMPATERAGGGGFNEATVELTSAELMRLSSADITGPDSVVSTQEMPPRITRADDSDNVTRPGAGSGFASGPLSPPSDEIDTESISQRVRMQGDRVVVLDDDVGSRDLTAPRIPQSVREEVMQEAGKPLSGPKVVVGYNPADTQDKTFEKPNFRTRLADFETRKPSGHPSPPSFTDKQARDSTDRDRVPKVPPRPGPPPRKPLSSRGASRRAPSASSSLIERVDMFAQSALQGASNQNIPQWAVVVAAFGALVFLMSLLVFLGWRALS